MLGICAELRESGIAPIISNLNNGAIAQVSIWFPTLEFFGIVAAFSEKYGKPTADKQSVVKNRMGAEFDNRTVEWIRSDGSLKLEQRGPDIETARILITTPSFYAEHRKASEEKARIAAAKL